VDEGLKKRLVGAAVLASLVVIFVPMLLEHEPVLESGIHQSNIPPRPDSDFSPRVLPLENANLADPEERVVPLQPDSLVLESAESQESAESAEAEETAEVPAPPKPRVGLTAWVVQVGSFSSRENAQNLTDSLRSRGFEAFIEQTVIRGQTLFRVKVGPEIDRKLAEELLQKVNEALKPEKLTAKLISYP
jgi:DedD protein